MTSAGLVTVDARGGPTLTPLATLTAAPQELQRAAAVGALRRRPQSRSELTEELGLSASVVSRLIGRLLQEHILCEMGVEAVGLGRPRTTLGVAPTAGRLASVVLQRHQLDAQMVDGSGRLLRQASRAVAAPLAPQVVLDFIAEVIDATASTAPLWGIGVSAPGIVDSDGSVRAAPDLGWTTAVPLRALLQDRFGPRVTVDNDVNLMVLAEATSGWAVGQRDVALIYLGQRGIGLGAISQGSLLTGATGASGEIGLLPLDLKNDTGTTLEHEFSLEAIARTLRESGLEATDDPMRVLASSADQDIVGDYLDDLVSSLTLAIGVAALILDPQLVVISGALRTVCRGREASMERALAGWLPRTPSIKLSELGNQEIHWAAQMRCWDQIVSTGL